MGLTADLAWDLDAIRTLSEKDIRQLKLLITDFFAAAYAGYRQNEPLNRAVEDVLLSRGGTPESFIFMRKEKAPAATAAFMNTIYGHGADMDDGNKQAAGHAGVLLIPAVFALADKLGSRNRGVFLALAAGYETFVRISAAAQPGLVQRGFHSTGMAGTIACAAACAKLFGLDAQGIEDAMALASMMASGLLSYGDSRPAVKPLNPANAAENGLLAAMLSQKGIQGPSEALEGPNGWFHAVTDEVHTEYLAGKDHLLLHDCYIKLYPSCRHTHCGIDGAVLLHDKVKDKAIGSVDLYIYPSAIRLAGIRDPQDVGAAKFSIPYTLACALVNGHYGIGDMDPRTASPEVRRMMERIRMIPDESLENRAAGIRGARLVIGAGDEVFEETVLVPRGDPENPLTEEDVREKLKVCAGPLLTEEKRGQLTAAIEGMDPEEFFRDPMALTAADRS